MKALFLFLLPFSLCFCTGNVQKKSSNPASHKSDSFIKGKSFFSFDSVEYYTSNFHDSSLPDLNYDKLKSALDSLKKIVLLEEESNKISDFSLVNKLPKIGYEKKNIDKAKYSAIDSIFTETSKKREIWSGYPRIYRDILLFRKHDSLIGVAKICFSCSDSYVIGSSANTHDFGSTGEFGRLITILKK